MIITDHSGDSLVGAIDGVNQVYRTSLPFDPESVEVFINGLRKLPALEDGYAVLDGQTVRLAEPRLAGDVISVSYALAGTNTLGGQPGGIPPPAAVRQDGPPAFTVEPASAPQTDAELGPPPFCAC